MFQPTLMGSLTTQRRLVGACWLLAAMPADDMAKKIASLFGLVRTQATFEGWLSLTLPLLVPLEFSLCRITPKTLKTFPDFKP